MWATRGYLSANDIELLKQIITNLLQHSRGKNCIINHQYEQLKERMGEYLRIVETNKKEPEPKDSREKSVEQGADLVPKAAGKIKDSAARLAQILEDKINQANQHHSS